MPLVVPKDSASSSHLVSASKRRAARLTQNMDSVSGRFRIASFSLIEQVNYLRQYQTILETSLLVPQALGEVFMTLLERALELYHLPLFELLDLAHQVHRQAQPLRYSTLFAAFHQNRRLS